MLHSITDVELAPLALPEVGQRSGPHGGLDYDDAVLLRAVKGVAHRVGHLVSVGAENPSRVVTFAGLVLRDRLKTTLIRVSSQNAVDLTLSVLYFFVQGVACLVVGQDVLSVVDPASLLGHLLSSGHGNGQLGVFRLVRLHIERKLAFLFALGDAVATSRHQLGGVVDTSDLSTQVVLLLLEVEGVSDDLALQVTREANLDLTGSLQVLGIQVGEAGPGTLARVGDEVGVLVDADAARLSAFGPLILRQVFGLEHLCDVVVFLSARDLAPEAHCSGISLLRQLLERLLEDEGAVLAELVPRLVEHMLVQGGQVLDKADHGATATLLVVLVGSRAASGEHLSELLDSVLGANGNLVAVASVGTLVIHTDEFFKLMRVGILD